MNVLRFYKLFSKENTLSSIALICNKIMESGEKIILFFENDDEMQKMDEKIWTFSQAEFLPHMTENSEEFKEFKDEVPILLTTKKENLIEAENLMIFKPTQDLNFLKNFPRTFFLFSPEVKEELDSARSFWKAVSALKSDFDSKLYEQDESRKWIPKV